MTWVRAVLTGLKSHSVEGCLKRDKWSSQPHFPKLPPPLFMRTVSFLLDGLGLRNSKTLHGLVFLRLRLVLMRFVLVLAVGVDQHSAVECVTVPPGTLAGPWDAIHYRGGRREKRGTFTTWLPGECYCTQKFKGKRGKIGEVWRGSQQKTPCCKWKT